MFVDVAAAVMNHQLILYFSFAQIGAEYSRVDRIIESNSFIDEPNEFNLEFSIIFHTSPILYFSFAQIGAEYSRVDRIIESNSFIDEPNKFNLDFSKIFHTRREYLVTSTNAKSRCVVKVFLENVIHNAVTYTEHAKRKAVTLPWMWSIPSSARDASSMVLEVKSPKIQEKKVNQK
ncbi:hypothetical protein LAZ67_17002946 [Cordylochernes scorpioides]|uniref:Histone H4 n=1 Tax=Cordylochernes scorpioides TaxID=51811 RepID=A0ABY6LEA0_9ARAC|nr:hypothetical protein LAZ67_17002946 [Cordylochernes scorpioides]